MDLDGEQAAPIPNDLGSVQAMVREDLVTRERIGRERYGTALQPHNGRDALRNAYEAALDLACYLRQAIAERDDARAANDDATAAGGIQMGSLRPPEPVVINRFVAVPGGGGMRA